MLSYPCICKGECTPSVEGLANCIMRSSKPNTYCKWCKNNMSRSRRREEEQYELEAF